LEKREKAIWARTEKKGSKVPGAAGGWKHAGAGAAAAEVVGGGDTFTGEGGKWGPPIRPCSSGVDAKKAHDRLEFLGDAPSPNACQGGGKVKRVIRGATWVGASISRERGIGNPTRNFRSEKQPIGDRKSKTSARGQTRTFRERKTPIRKMKKKIKENAKKWGKKVCTTTSDLKKGPPP